MWLQLLKIKTQNVRCRNQQKLHYVYIHVLTTSTKSDLPWTHFRMSLANIMLSGQAQVYLGENLLIWGAARHRNSQPPLLTPHQLIPGKIFRISSELHWRRFLILDGKSIHWMVTGKVLSNVWLYDSRHTSRLLEVVVQDNVLWGREVFGHFRDVSSSHTICT